MTMIEKAQEYGRAYATDLFVCMLNPKYRGPQLTWDKLIEMISYGARINVFMSFSDKVWTKHKDKLEIAAEIAARRCIHRYLEMSGVRNWLHLPSENTHNE